MRLQDAIIGPSVILSFKKPIRVFDRSPRRGHKLGTELPLAWRPAPDIPPKLPVSAGYPFLSPGVATQPRAPRNSLAPTRHKSVDSPPPRRRRDPKQQGQGKVQTGEKIRAPEQRARSQQLP